MADRDPTSSVDETPLSPIDRQQSLEKHLQMRPEAQDLKNRNILHDTNAAPYVPNLAYANGETTRADDQTERYKPHKLSWSASKQLTT